MRNMFCKYISQSVAYLFVSYQSFEEQKPKTLMKSLFFFMVHAFYAVLEIFVNSKIAVIFFLFSSGNFDILALTFRPMVHYEFLVLFNNTNLYYFVWHPCFPSIKAMWY